MSLAGLADQTVQRPAPVVCRALAPLLLTKAWPASVAVPVPTFRLTPLAMTMSPLPESRCAGTAPGSLATAVRLPLAVVTLALKRMLRPACNVSAPPVLPATVIALEMVRSLLACNVTAVPLASRFCRFTESRLTSVAAELAK